MTDGTSQGLFIVVAIVIFGIFVVLAYILFEDTLSPAMANMFTTATEQAETRLNSNVNLIEKYDMEIVPHKITVVEKSGYDYTIKSTGADLAGINIIDKRMAPDKKYVLSFKVTEIDGEISRIGGHIGVSNEMDIYINNVLKVDTMPEDITNRFSVGVPYDMQKGETIDVRVEFTSNTYHEEKYPDTPLKIQLNRHFLSPDSTGFGKEYTAKISDIKLMIVD